MRFSTSVKCFSFEGGFPGGQMSPPAPSEWSPTAPPQPPALHNKLTDMTLTVRLHDLDHLTVSKTKARINNSTVTTWPYVSLSYSFIFYFKKSQSHTYMPYLPSFTIG